MKHPIVWLRHAGQELGLVPSLGGAVAAWRCIAPDGGAIDLWRPWDGQSEDLYHCASFAMVPWSNRISQGGFRQDGRWYPMQANRRGEPYPIHGDGWLQAWQLHRPRADTMSLTLQSRAFGGNPYAYAAAQTFSLVEGGMDQTIDLELQGDAPMPCGIGLHPWFPRTPGTRLQAPVQGVWLGGTDPIPTAYTQQLPDDWNLDAGISAHGSTIDNGFGGWGGHATIAWPERRLRLTAAMPDFARDGGGARHFCLVYRPQEGPAFCFEPITHPIDAFHLPNRPGLRVLAPGESMRLRVQWRFERF